jgi:streptogramin lyase
MTRFTDRVERDLGQIADRASPSSTAWEAIQHRIDEQDTTESTMEVIMLSPDRNQPSTRSRSWIYAAAAAAVVALVGGLIVFGNLADEDQLPADQPPQTIPAEPEPETATPVAPEPEPEPPTATAVVPEPEPEPETTNAPPPVVGFNGPTDLVVVADGGLMVVDTSYDRVVRVDPVTADRTLVSNTNDPNSTPTDAVTGSGPEFISPRGVAVEADGNLLVLDIDLTAVIRVDPVTGDRTVVSDASTGSGPAFETLLGGIAVEADGNVVVTGAQTVVRVDPVTGDRTVVSDASTGSGPAFGTPLGNVSLERSIAVEADGNLLVVDSDLAAVIRVDPVTGDRTVVSDASTGSGPAFGARLGGIAVEADGNVVVTGARSVVRVDPVTGDRTVVSDASTGDGIGFIEAFGIAVEADGSLVVTDNLLWAVIRVDPVTGDRSNASS